MLHFMSDMVLFTSDMLYFQFSEGVVPLWNVSFKLTQACVTD